MLLRVDLLKPTIDQKHDLRLQEVFSAYTRPTSEMGDEAKFRTEPFLLSLVRRIQVQKASNADEARLFDDSKRLPCRQCDV